VSLGLLCEASPVTLVWVTGTSGVGKSTVCALLKSRGHLAIDADGEGFNHWVGRTGGEVITDPPNPVPSGWLDRFAWLICPSEVEALAERCEDKTALLFGSVENEVDVWDLFDLVICLVADNETIRDRLQTRVANPFGKNPEELAAALKWNETSELTNRRRGATIIDGKLPPSKVADAVVAAVTNKAPVHGSQ
jgi:AAA domain